MTKISIIIPTYNEAEVITACLDSLKTQSFKEFEVVVVDDGSGDDTLSTLSKYKFPGKLTLLKQNHLGPGEARNLGAGKASGEILVFVDADMTFDRDFLENLVKPIINGTVKGTFSKEEYVSNWDSIWSKCWNLNEGWEDKRRHPKKYPDHQKVFRAILKSEFDRVGGFDSKKGYMDDWTLSEKLKYEAVNAPNAVFYHKNPDSLFEVFTQAKWIGKRPYKLGKLGQIFALLRASLPESLWEGFWKSLRKKTPEFLIFKVVYDFGVFIGILTNMLTKKNTR